MAVVCFYVLANPARMRKMGVKLKFKEIFGCPRPVYRQAPSFIDFKRKI
jgi:hypothetical protein